MRTLQFGLIASGFEKYGSQEALEKNAIQHLLEIYVKVNADSEQDPTVREQAAAWFKRMEDGDEEALKNWRVWREKLWYPASERLSGDHQKDVELCRTLRGFVLYKPAN